MTNMARFTALVARAVALSCVLVHGSSALAQGNYGKASTMVVPYPPGGPSDFLARQVVPQLTQGLGETLIVENIGGAAGTIGVKRVLDRPADGRNMLYVTPMELVIAPLTYQSANFQPQDVKFIAHMSTSDVVLLTRKDLAAATVEDLIRLGKSSATPLNYGTLGQGSLFHLIAERFIQLTGVAMNQIPYKGTGPMLQELAGGQIDLVFAPLSGNLPGLIRDGRVKALGIASRSVNPMFPEIPPLASKPALKDFEFNTWSGIAVPPAVPADRVARLHAEANKILSSPQFRSSVESGGGRVPQPKSLTELSAMYDAEIVRFHSIAKTVNLQPER